MNNKDIIKQKIKISDYIKTDLIKHGNTYKCLSPFTNEKTPSFYIKDDNGIQVFKCFSSGKSGDIFSFLIYLEDKSFGEVYNELCEKLKLTTDYTEAKTAQKPYVNVLTKTNSKFIFDLFDNQPILDYLVNDRQLTLDTIKRFDLGWVDADLLGWLTQQNLPLALAAEVGLIGKKENYYTTMRTRITIPIKNINGNIIGIATRKFLPDDNFGKYVFPPNNVLLKKTNFLYNIDQAKSYIKEKDFVILTEGFFDVISLSQAGFNNVVAINGTSVYSGQVKSLTKYTDNFYLCLDGDKAGYASVIKNCKELIKNEVNVFIIELENGLDPDEFIKLNGPAAFTTKINNAKNIFEFLPNCGESLISILEELSTIVPKISSDIRRQFWITNIERTTGINIQNNIKKSYYDIKHEEELTQKDTLLLRLFMNADEESKKFLESNKTFKFDTDFGKLIYLKIKNTKYSIDFADNELSIIKLLKSEKTISMETIKKKLSKLNELNLLQ